MALDGNAVRSVDRAAALLLALGESQGEAGVTELARRLGLHKSTASRLLATLQRRGLVEQDDETGKYRLGLVVIRLAERAEKTLDLRGIALPELERLARVTTRPPGSGSSMATRSLPSPRWMARTSSPSVTGRVAPPRSTASHPGRCCSRTSPSARSCASSGAGSSATRNGPSPSSSRSSRSSPGSVAAVTRPRSASTSSV